MYWVSWKFFGGLHKFLRKNPNFLASPISFGQPYGEVGLCFTMFTCGSPGGEPLNYPFKKEPASSCSNLRIFCSFPSRPCFSQVPDQSCSLKPFAENPASSLLVILRCSPKWTSCIPNSISVHLPKYFEGIHPMSSCWFSLLKISHKCSNSVNLLTISVIS